MSRALLQNPIADLLPRPPRPASRKGRLLARDHRASYMERFGQPGEFTVFVLVLHSMAVLRFAVEAGNADLAAAAVHARIDLTGGDICQYDVIMTVPGIVGECTDLDGWPEDAPARGASAARG
ncbi:MAG TPA: hypothetical protein VMU42_04000 [Candidatus Sulfotelmatobacter sp.]|nr:hypothetical protein [Candidatus Sulfotelmatobacter sp.]